MTLRKSAKEIFPVPSLSTSPIIFLISSFLGSNPRALIATWRQWGRRTDQYTTGNRFFLPRHVLIVFSVFCLSDLCFTLSSLTSMCPEPSVSNSSKASLISCFCSSVSSGLGVVFLRGGGTGPCRDGLLALVAWWDHRRGGRRKRKIELPRLG